MLLPLPSDAMPTVPFPPKSFCGYYLGYESFLYYFLAPWQIFIIWFFALLSSNLFLFNLRSVDRVVFHEAWWTWRLHKKGRWVLLGLGRIIIKVLYGEVLHRSPNTYSLLYTGHFCEKGTPFVYLLSTNWYPFHIPSLELSIPFKIWINHKTRPQLFKRWITLSIA